MLAFFLFLYTWAIGFFLYHLILPCFYAFFLKTGRMERKLIDFKHAVTSDVVYARGRKWLFTCCAGKHWNSISAWRYPSMEKGLLCVHVRVRVRMRVCSLFVSPLMHACESDYLLAARASAGIASPHVDIHRWKKVFHVYVCVFAFVCVRVRVRALFVSSLMNTGDIRLLRGQAPHGDTPLWKKVFHVYMCVRVCVFACVRYLFLL